MFQQVEVQEWAVIEVEEVVAQIIASLKDFQWQMEGPKITFLTWEDSFLA